MLAASTAIPACTERECTAAGCDNIVSFVVPELAIERGTVARATICIDGRCETGGVKRLKSGIFHDSGSDNVTIGPTGASLRLSEESEPGGVHRVALRLHRPGHDMLEVEEEVTLRENRPNGPDCGPVCAFAEVQVDPP